MKMTQIWKEKSMFSMKLYLNSLPNPKKLISIDINDKILAIAISSADLSKSYVNLLLLLVLQSNLRRFREVACHTFN